VPAVERGECTDVMRPPSMRLGLLGTAAKLPTRSVTTTTS